MVGAGSVWSVTGGSYAGAGGGGGGACSEASAARSISETKDADVFWTSRIKRPACRIILGNRSGPNSSSARTETTAMSGSENIAGFLRYQPHRGLQRKGSPARPYKHLGPAVKIIYTRGNRTETLASPAALRQILDRFAGRHVFYEMSGRQRHGRAFFSVKNVFTVGSIEITNLDHLHILIFDAKAQSHSIEIVNPHTMKIYDEQPHRSFAVAFVS
jgi:hypothetical protein